MATQLISGRDYDQLAYDVNQLLTNGYSPVGGLTRDGDTFYQMVQESSATPGIYYIVADETDIGLCQSITDVTGDAPPLGPVIVHNARFVSAHCLVVPAAGDASVSVDDITGLSDTIETFLHAADDVEARTAINAAEAP